MKLKNEINEKLKIAMREKNVDMLKVLRSIIAKITESEKSASSKELSDDDIIVIIEKLAKQREESILLFTKGGREDLVSIEEFELNVLKEYLPVKMTESETRSAVETAIASGSTNMGLLMKDLNRYGNLIDKKLASSIAKEIFN